MRMFPRTCCVLLWAFLACPATAQQVSPTRGVVVFSQLEGELATAVGGGDQPGVDRLLSAEFEQRAATAPDQPQPRAEWLAERKGAAAWTPTRMAVHDYGDIAVASFVAEGGAARSTVIDIWRRHGADWQLQLRFVAAAPAEAPQDARPDGKH
ncbi:MAG TPA: hypothetical protein VLM17_08515 [Xanthomonadaceae bacterium]|nr:hypothetical protein [Xanthomonadaceae bacterium]